MEKESTSSDNLIMWEVYVPTMSNAHVPFRTKFHKYWDSKVRKVSGGLTVFKPAVGQWVSPAGTLFKERMIPVRIMCTAAQMDKIADITAAHYDQIAILYFKVGEGKIKHYSSKK